jgi:hypothetical protein
MAIRVDKRHELVTPTRIPTIWLHLDLCCTTTHSSAHRLCRSSRLGRRILELPNQDLRAFCLHALEVPSRDVQSDLSPTRNWPRSPLRCRPLGSLDTYSIELRVETWSVRHRQHSRVAAGQTRRRAVECLDNATVGSKRHWPVSVIYQCRLRSNQYLFPKK